MKPSLKKSLFAIILVCLTATAVSAGEKPVMRILTWSGDYIDTDPSMDPSIPITKRSPTLRSFMEAHKCEIVYEEYDSQEAMLRKAVNYKGYYDLIVLTSDVVGMFLKAEKLSPISDKEVPNKKHIHPSYGRLPVDPKGDYFIPYLAGTTAIAYRMDLVPRKIETWGDYFNPSPNLKGKIGVLDTSYSICHAMQFLGIDIHTKDEEKIKEAAKLFYNLKNMGYLTLLSGETPIIKEKLIDGTLAMTTLYSGSTLRAMKQDSRIRYVIPKEGGEYFLDCIVLMKDAPRKDLAAAFLNHILEPEVHAAISLSLNYIVPNRGALEIIRKKHPEIYRHPAIYLDDETRGRLELFQNISLETVNRLWRKITR